MVSENHDRDRPKEERCKGKYFNNNNSSHLLNTHFVSDCAKSFTNNMSYFWCIIKIKKIFQWITFLNARSCVSKCYFNSLRGYA